MSAQGRKNITPICLLPSSLSLTNRSGILNLIIIKALTATAAETIPYEGYS